MGYEAFGYFAFAYFDLSLLDAPPTVVGSPAAIMLSGF